MTEIAAEAAQHVLLWSAVNYDPGLALMALSWAVAILLFVGTSPWWAPD